MAHHAIPQSVEADAHALRQSALLLAAYVHEQAIAELAGFRAERRLTQRFRAAQTVAVLSAAHALLLDVKGATAGTAKVPPEYLRHAADAIAELQPLVDALAHDDEIDDAI
eukprot:4134313-Prymnesium_polylepis.2